MPGIPSRPDVSGDRVEYQRFPSRYFSGADVDIYFKDLYIDEITGIEFQIQENIQPIYGYASYRVDAWARGNRIITGTFRINFRSPYYLHYIINEIEFRKREGEPSGESLPDENISPISGRQLIDQASGISTRDSFETLSNRYQKAMWGETVNEPFQDLMDNRKIDSFFYPKNRRPIVHEEGFDIFINYGDVPKSIDELQTTGDVSPEKSVKIINGVQITGASQVINGEGRPIEEEYTFLAKDMDIN